MTSRVFLTGEWRSLAMLDCRFDPALLEPLVPRGTSLDRWQDVACVSLVGFRFRDTRVLGVALSRHRHFEEVNLRFYVRRDAGSEVRRGVTFIEEIVPQRATALVARLACNELGRVVARPPDSAFIAEGSRIEGYTPVGLEAE